MDDEKIMNMDLSTMSELQQIFYCDSQKKNSIVGCKKRSLLHVWGAAKFETMDLVCYV